jgi:glycosyltransferase involved in cell wall biosynthesis
MVGGSDDRVENHESPFTSHQLNHYSQITNHQLTMRLSVITPAFNEASNLKALHERLVAVLDAEGMDWDWLIVDDHSRDETFAVASAIAAADSRVAAVRFARNTGSHAAIACGLRYATGDAAVVLAADLQDPPETLPVLIRQWRDGAQMVWAVRRRRLGEERQALGFARLYYFVMRELVGIREMPASGADFFLADRLVLDQFRRFDERHISVLALLTWMGFRQVFVEYDKQPRMSGRSGWSLSKKVTLLLDSIIGFSEFPIRWCSYAGVALLAVSPVVAVASSGLAALMVGLAGMQLIAIGVVGEYVWRGLDAARRRPLFLIEAATGPLPARGSVPQAAVE